MIKLVNISKSYLLSGGKRHYVFRDLSFTFPEGANIGLIGPNGAGKSTLMNILGGIDIPDTGKVITDKSISWTVGLGGGLQVSLTARDNVKFVARVYGYNGQDMREKVRYVEEFAEIGEFFDQPIKKFSAGMRARVTFGLSLAFDFDYYLIDEAGAVGDANFKKKSMAAYKEKLKSGNVILVSHNMAEIRSLCDHIILVNNGKAQIFENIEEGIGMYQEARKNI